MAYHAVTSYRLTRSSLALALTSAPADALELPERIELSLDLPDEDFDCLSVGLGEMLPEAVAENA